MRIHSITVACACSLLALVGAPGCLVSSKRDTSYSGNYVDSGKLAELKVNQSTADEVRTKLGEPDDKTVLASGDEEWRWHYSKTEKSSGAVLFVLASSSNKTTPASVVVTLRNGVVVSKRYEANAA